jgi:hypothetical protein
MNLFNRVFVVLLLVLLIPVLVLVILAGTFPGVLVGSLRQGLAAWESPSLAMQVTAIVVAAVLLVVDLALLFLEFRRPGPQTVRLLHVANGEAGLTTSSIEQRLTQAIHQVPDVVKVSPTVIGKRKGVEVVLNLETSPEVDVPAKTDEVVAVTRDVVEHKMGLALLKVKVNLRLAGPPGARRRPQPASTPPQG